MVADTSGNWLLAGDGGANCEAHWELLTMQIRPVVNIEAFMAARYVRIGRLLVHASEVEKRLHWFIKPLVVNTGDARFPYGLRGSALTARMNGRHFLLFCRHQITGLEPEQIVFPPHLRHGTTFVGGGVHTFIEADNANSDEEYIDVCCFEIEAENVGIENFESEFFDAMDSDLWPNNTLGKLVLFGYPSQDQKYDLDDAEAALAHLGTVCVVTSAEYAGTSHARWTHTLEMTRTRDFDPDGISGGAVFHVGEDREGYFVGLAGIIIRGGAASNYLRFVDTRALRQFATRSKA